MPSVIGKKAAVKSAKKQISFVIDCGRPASDDLVDVQAFQVFLKQKVKVNGKVGNLGDHVKFTLEKNKLLVIADIHMSKRYLKYLTKKFLKSQNLRDWIRVVASSKDRSGYELRYFNIDEGEGDEGQ